MSDAGVRASIVIPTLNREEQLRACLTAIRELQPPEGGFEVIVVDDGGEQPLDRLVADVAGPLSVRLHRQGNLGPSAARNAGAALARGELLAFVDDDVLLSTGWLRTIDEAHRPSSRAAIGGRVNLAPGAGAAAEVSELIVELGSERQDRPEDPRFLPSNNLALPADDFHQLGGFDESFLFAEDRELCRRWRASGRPLRYVEHAVCNHAKVLSPSQFVGQHFRYGRGAYDFWRVSPGRGGLRGVVEPDFYRRVAAVMWKFLRGGRFAHAALIVLWQLANAAGYVWAGVRSR